MQSNSSPKQLSLEDILMECTNSNQLVDSFASSTLPDEGDDANEINYFNLLNAKAGCPEAPRSSRYYGTQYSNPTVDFDTIGQRFSVDSLNCDNKSNKTSPTPSNLYLPLKNVANSEASPDFYLTLNSEKGGIHPPLSPDSSMKNSASSYYLRLTSQTEGINPPLSPQASNWDSYVALGGSIKSGIYPPLTPQSSFSDAASTPLGRVPSGINPPLTPLGSAVDSTSGSYFPLGSIKSGFSGINPPLSPQGSTVDSASYVPIGSVKSGIHPSLSEHGSILGSRCTLSPFSADLSQIQQDNPLYRSYDTVNISSDELAETESLDDGQVGDTEDNSEVNGTDSTLQSKKSKADGKCKKKKESKSVRKRIKEGLGRVGNTSRNAGSKREKYSSGFSSDSNASSDEGSSSTFVGSCSSGTQKSDVSKTPASQSTTSNKSQFASQLSKSIRQKLLSGRSSKSGLKNKRKSDNISLGGSFISHSEAIAKSRSLPLSDLNNVNRHCENSSSEKVKGYGKYSESSKSRFVRTLTMPLKLASQRRQSLSRIVQSKSQPTTPEMSRKHRVIQSYTRPRTGSNMLVSSGSFSGASSQRIRDPLNVNTSLNSQDTRSVRSLFISKEKNSIKHISKPILPLADPASFQRLTCSTRSLMCSREKNSPRALVPKISEGRPPIASKPAPHHSSENLHKIHLRNDFYDPPPFINSHSRVSPPSDMSLTLSEASAFESQLCLEVCDKCRQNVADGIQHPSIWAIDLYIPLGYTRTKSEIDRLETVAKKKGYKEDCKLQ